jgi:hypothetical protein
LEEIYISDKIASTIFFLFFLPLLLLLLFLLFAVIDGEYNISGGSANPFNYNVKNYKDKATPQTCACYILSQMSMSLFNK